MNANPGFAHDGAQLANAALVHALAPHQELRSVPNGSVIFSEGDWPAGVHILLAGAIDMRFSAQPLDPVRLQTLGTILGLNATVSTRTYDYTAVGHDGAVVGFVPQAKFLEILNGAPALWLEVLKVLSRDIGSCYERVRELAAH
ncbi:MAG TPA: Crp/Fnr family transcriptional regulator [Thermoanaerobaculia bacterium]|nr:Crp/Fnr family transcriptional regulator [Thermoanaerobaculia bacterium]